MFLTFRCVFERFKRKNGCTDVDEIVFYILHRTNVYATGNPYTDVGYRVIAYRLHTWNFHTYLQLNGRRSKIYIDAVLDVLSNFFCSF